MPAFAPVAPGVFAQQGGWWYRGEFHLRPEAGGTRLVFGSSVRPDSDPRDPDLPLPLQEGQTDALRGDHGPA